MVGSMDLNCDLGESFGAYVLGHDAALLPHITSANVACGLHAGDPTVMERTVQLCVRHHVGVGAHVGYPDLAGFGRRAMDMAPAELEACVLYQVGALHGFCRGAGVPLQHVKPHGALYNVAAWDSAVAAPVVRAVRRFDPGLLLYAPPGSALALAAQAEGLRVVAEGFADRAYNADGSLVDRRRTGAVHPDAAAVVAQAVRLATRREVVTLAGGVIAWPVESLCVHGDTPGAVEWVACIRSALQKAGVEVRPCRT